eukprot:scaffold320482_cov13-Tisochrysis_lutea.AAC.1
MSEDRSSSTRGARPVYKSAGCSVAAHVMQATSAGAKQQERVALPGHLILGGPIAPVRSRDGSQHASQHDAPYCANSIQSSRLRTESGRRAAGVPGLTSSSHPDQLPQRIVVLALAADVKDR